jgi:RNA polymerase sigma factor (sigma-70 family)
MSEHNDTYDESIDPLALARAPKRKFKDEQPEPDDADGAAETTEAEGEAEAKVRKPIQPQQRIPREEFRSLVTRAILGDTKARDELITLADRLGHMVLCSFDEETRRRAVMAVTDKFFRTGMVGGIALGLYFDINRSGALVSYLVRSLKHAAVDELRKKRAIRDAMDRAIPYESTAEDDGEQTRSPALEVQRLGHDEDGMPIIPGADSIDPLRQVTAQQLFEAAMSANLTPREHEVANLRARGEDYEQIAASLNIAASGARRIAASALKKIHAVADAAS